MAKKNNNSTPEPPAFHIQIILAREETQFTQKEICERLDIQKNQLSQWERGKKTPTYDNLLKLLDFYGFYNKRLMKERVIRAWERARTKELEMKLKANEPLDNPENP